MKRKSIIITIFCMALMCSILFALSACGTGGGEQNDIGTDGLVFDSLGSGNDCIVSGYTGSEGIVVIPKTYNGMRVVQIREKAFSGKNNLIRITIPDSVTNIGYDAFGGCTSLASVYYTGDVASWCRITFDSSYQTNPLHYAHNLYINNKLVTYLIIPDEVTEIKKNAFVGATCFTDASIPNSVTSIGDGAFAHCNALKSITIGSRVTSIGVDAFAECTSLASVTIPHGVREIEMEAFYNCTALTSVTIPNSVMKINWSAFKSCSALTNITFNGTKAQWNAINKVSGWNTYTGSYTIHCFDGDIAK